MSAGNESKIVGGLGSISLHDLIQLLGMNRSTTTLVLRRQDHEGRIYFRNGNVVHAFTGDLEGPDAFAELLKWQDAHFIVEEGVPTLPKVTISESAVGLMLSSMTRLDEDSRDTPAGGTPAVKPRASAPPKPPTSGRFAPHARRRGRGRVISGPRRSATSPIIPIVGVTLLVAAGAGVTWWVLDAGSEAPAAARAATSPSAAAAPTPTTRAPEGPEPTPAAEGAAPGTPAPSADPIESAPEAAPTPTPAPDGVLEARAPPGAELRIDGRRMETGAHRVSPGRHTIEVIRPEVLGVQRETVEIEPGQTLRRTYTADEYGWLQVVVIPWAEVFVEGTSIGQTPMPRMKAAVGQHTLVLRHPEVEERRETVVVRQGETSLVRVTLQGVSG
jgi:hypothetical protein